MAVSLDTLRTHFFERAHWVDPDSSADRVFYGDLGREVRKIGLGWMPCVQNLEAAAAAGCDLFISHETMFYGEWAPGIESEQTVWGQARLAVLKKHDMACINLHDTWDNFPEYGIRDSWRTFLGLSEPLAERSYYYRGTGRFAQQKSLVMTRTAPQTLAEFATVVASQCSIFPMSHGVTVQGDADARIETVATGVGCHIPTWEMAELGADVLVLTYDRALQTAIRIPLLEMGCNLICVEHGVSELPGMQSMARYLERTFPVTATFYCCEPGARTVLARRV